MKKVIPTLLAIMIIFLMSNTVRVFAQAQPATGGCLNLSGATVACEPYIDIVSSDVSMSNGAYTGTITLAGPVPSSSSTYLEWDIAIDDLRTANTNYVCAGTPGCSTAQSNLVFNGINVDYLIVYNLWNNPCDNGANANDNTPCTFYYFNSNHVSSLPVPAKVQGNTIRFSWTMTTKSFDFLFLAGIYSDAGNTFSELLSFDKAPNAGYYAFQSGNVIAVPELTAPPIVAFVALIISFGVLNYHRRLRGTKFG